MDVSTVPPPVTRRGTPGVAGPVGLRAAIPFFEQAGRDALRRHEEELVRHGLARLRDVPS